MVVTVVVGTVVIGDAGDAVMRVGGYVVVVGVVSGLWRMITSCEDVAGGGSDRRPPNRLRIRSRKVGV
jgi:hypothetical protein